MTAGTLNNVKRKDGIRGTGRKQFVMYGGSSRDSSGFAELLTVSTAFSAL